MHEASIANEVLNIVLATLCEYKEKNDMDSSNIILVSEITIKLGQFRNLDSESFKFSFDALKLDYLETRKSNLSIINIEAQTFCQKNKHLFTPEAKKYYACPICGSEMGKIISGEEFEIEKIKLELKTSATISS